MGTKGPFGASIIICVICILSAGPSFGAIRPVREVQQALVVQGFDAGTPDGIWGSKSIDALKGFQRAHGLTPSGVVTQDSLTALFPTSSANMKVAAAAPLAVATAELLSAKPDTALSERGNTAGRATPQTSDTSVVAAPTQTNGAPFGYVVGAVLLVMGFLFVRSRRKKVKRSGGDLFG